MDFKDFYIKVGQPGAWSSNMNYPATIQPSWASSPIANPVGLNDQFNVKVKHVPYRPIKDIKEPTVQTWKDEEGDDVWLPMTSTGSPATVHEAFDLSVTFVYHAPSPSEDAPDGGIITVIDNLLSMIEGRWLQIFDTYTGIGYDGVYFAGMDDDPTFKKRGMETGIFTLKFHVNGLQFTQPFA